MLTTDTHDIEDSWLQSFLSDERFWPSEPHTLEETGLTIAFLESLVCKYLAVSGSASGRMIAESVGLSFQLLEEVLGTLRTRQVIVHSGAAPFNDYYYMLTETGQQRAEAYQRACAYVGPAPVPLKEYVLSVEAQGISTESPSDQQLAEACAGISVDKSLFDFIGPAVNSGGGMFLYGAPGNGKSTLARCITACFGQSIWIPHTLIDDNQLIKLFDASCHHEMEDHEKGILKGRDFDRRWVRIKRPTVSVGGELTLDNLEIRHDPVTNVNEAPLQLKSNCGCLLIDDFGRQRVEPSELLNRWIVPLETGHDFLTFTNGRKIQVPFEQLTIFSTNLEPRDLVDEAFLRRIPYKIELADPSEEEFYELFAMYAEKLGCQNRPEAVRHLLERHYRPRGRALRRCHPRDLLKQMRGYCQYKRLPFEMRPDLFDKVVNSYFAMVFGDK